MAGKKPDPIAEAIARHNPANVRRIDPRRVPTAEWVRMKCRYGCGGYGRCLMCPPHSPTPAEARRMLDEYTVAYLIHWTGGAQGRRTVVEIEREVFLMGYAKAFAMGSGPCRLCGECDVDQPCRRPEDARPAMEACGIDVFGTAALADLPIRVVTSTSDEPDFYSLLLVE